MRAVGLTQAAASAGVVFRVVAAAVRAGLLSAVAAAAVVVGVAMLFGAGWAWVVGGVLGMLLSADWRASRAAAAGDGGPV